MTPLEQFTQITMNIVQKKGLDQYIPTLMVRATRQVHLIEGIPPEIARSEALQEIILREGLQKEEFFFAIQTGKDELTTGHYRPEEVAFMTIIRSEEEYTSQPAPSCGWWRISSSETLER